MPQGFKEGCSWPRWSQRRGLRRYASRPFASIAMVMNQWFNYFERILLWKPSHAMKVLLGNFEHVCWSHAGILSTLPIQKQEWWALYWGLWKQIKQWQAKDKCIIRQDAINNNWKQSSGSIGYSSTSTNPAKQFWDHQQAPASFEVMSDTDVHYSNLIGQFGTLGLHIRLWTLFDGR
jgi:hypothetical protein